jgi:myo-inositol-1(or 4)-monophosphatase
MQAQYKSDGELVTEADHLAEAAIVDRVLTEFPDHNIVSEESSPEFTTKPRWIVDPIDGTTNYLNGIPHYAVSIAYQGVRSPDVGIVYHVPTDTMFTAVEGEGAYANGHPLSLSETSSLSEALVVTGFDPATMQSQEFEQFRQLLSVTQGVRRFGSAASEVSMVAAGQFDAFFERMLSVWDTAAGVLLVEEAGGEVTRIKFIDGQNSEMVLASNRQLHQDLVTLVSSGTVPE